MEESCPFMVQERVNSNGEITVPDRVRSLLFKDGGSTEKQYLWGYAGRGTYMRLATDPTEVPTFLSTYTSQALEENPNKTIIPEEIRSNVGLEEGDDLYFTAAMKSQSDDTPIVSVEPYEVIEERVLRAIEGSSLAQEVDGVLESLRLTNNE